jgi:hypothetical protein
MTLHSRWSPVVPECIVVHRSDRFAASDDMPRLSMNAIMTVRRLRHGYFAAIIIGLRVVLAVSLPNRSGYQRI